MASNYSRGANLERKIQDLWEMLGADVTRSAGSHGEADLWIAIGKQLIVAQSQTENYFSPEKIERLQGLARRHDAVGILYWQGDKKIPICCRIV